MVAKAAAAIVRTSRVASSAAKNARQIRQQTPQTHSLYEANPMIIIVEQACVMSATSHEHILVLACKVLHQGVPVIYGSKNEVEVLLGYHMR